VTALSTGESYAYDANSNMISRTECGLTYSPTFDAENRLISVAVGGQTTQFIYDGDDNLVKKINPDGSKTLYVGGIYEVDKTSGGTVTQTRTYYPAGGAMRVGSTLYYVLKDHLGSASAVTDTSGNIVGEDRFLPFGETRFTTGTMYTDKLFTGQRALAGLGIYHYGARFYSPYINRFVSADIVVPGYTNPQSLNRYSYVTNNPLRYTDPTGHWADDGYVGNHNSTNCTKYPQYCNNGKPKSADELARMRNKKDKNHHDTGPITNLILQLPGTAEDWNNIATGFDLLSRVTDLYAASTTSLNEARGGTAIFPGQDPSDEEKKSILQFFQSVNKQLNDLLEDKNLPMILTGVEHILRIFRQVCTYDNLLADSIFGNFDQEDLKEIHGQARQMAKPILKKAKGKPLKNLRVERATEWLSNQ
jgi:RHS repeat-associated protein